MSTPTMASPSPSKKKKIDLFRSKWHSDLNALDVINEYDQNLGEVLIAKFRADCVDVQSHMSGEYPTQVNVNFFLQKPTFINIDMITYMFCHH